ncbi:MAG: hypothetical protein ACK2UY_06900, partial [Anaerolineae bacterium]
MPESTSRSAVRRDGVGHSTAKAGTTNLPARCPLVDAAALLGLAALVLLTFWKLALTNRVLAGVDVFSYFYPYREYVNQALRAGRLPLWNPYLFMGAPLLANSQAAVLYPLHWPLIWLDAPRQVAWSIAIHIWLAGAGTYLFARRALRLQPLAAGLAAVTLALGGFLGAQVEHLNQLNASAWLPWLLLCVEGAATAAGPRRRWGAVLAGALVAGLTLLAGHTQAAYIVFCGAGAFSLLRGLPHLRRRRWAAGLRGLGGLLLMGLGGAALAAAQLLPTLELSRLSVRSSGLPYNEAASFSLKPTLVFKAFLPPLLWQPPFSEYVAYVGLAGLALAGLGAWAVLRRRRPGGSRRPGAEMLALALLGVFLAFGAYNPIYYVLYKLMPGFDLFRAPARWLLLYAFGAALLAGAGLEALPDILDRILTRRPGAGERRQRAWQMIIVLFLILELFLAGRRLAHNRATAPAAFHSMRSATAHLLADRGGEPFRFLSMSDTEYDPGDLADLRTMYQDCLTEAEIYDLVVATKRKEVLAYNLPLTYRLASVDGYDGGLLPIARYVTLEHLFLDEDEIWPDGRLRQQLRQVPPARLLSLLNVKYVITDKTQDVWIDGTFYDLEHTVPLGRLTLRDLPAFETTHLGVVSYLTGTVDIPNGTPVARLTITGTQGTVVTAELRTGEHTAEGHYQAGAVAHAQATVGHTWRDDPGGSDYIAVLDLGQRIALAALSIHSLLPGQAIRLRGLTLIDEETGTSRWLSIHPAYQLVHSGDVKIYQNREVLPRAFAVYRALAAADDGAALALLRDPDVDPARQVILDRVEVPTAAPNLPDTPPAVRILAYEAEEVRIEADLEAPGYLVLTDTYYPGWQAEVDGRPASIQRADVYFRAVALEAGR